MYKKLTHISNQIITLVDKKSELTLISYVIGVSESEKKIENNSRREERKKTVDFRFSEDKKIYTHYFSNKLRVLRYLTCFTENIIV